MSLKEFAISFLLSGEVDGKLTKSFKKAGDQVSGLSKKVTAYRSEASKLEVIKSMRKENSALTKVFLQERKELAELNETIKKTKNPSSKLTSYQEKLSSRFEKTTQKLERQKQTLDKLSKSMRVSGASTKQLEERQKKLYALADKHERDNERNTNRQFYKQAGKATLGYVSYKAIEGAKTSINIGADVQKRLSMLEATAPIKQDEKEQLKDYAISQSEKSGSSAAQLIDAMTRFRAANFDVAQTKAATSAADKLAAISGMSVEEAAKSTITSMRSFGAKADQASYFVDVFANAAKSGHKDLSYFVEASSEAGSIAKKYNVNFAEYNAMAAALAESVGGSGSSAAGKIKKAATVFNAPQGEQAKMLKLLGVKIDDGKGNLRHIFDIMADYHRAKTTHKLTEKEAAKLDLKMFGDDNATYVSSLAEKAARGELQSTTQGFNVRGTSKASAKIAEDNFSTSLSKLWHAIEGLGTRVFYAIESPLTKAVDLLTLVTSSISKFADDFPNVTATITAIGGAMGVARLLDLGKNLLKIASLFGIGSSATGGVLAGAGATGKLGKLLTKIPKAGWLSLLSIIPMYLDLMESKVNPEEAKKRFEDNKVNPEVLINETPMASGGIVTRPTLALVGEGRESEAVLPLSKLDGLLNTSGNNMTVHFSPTINISGGGDAYSEVKRALAEGQINFKRELERLLADQRRLSFS